MLRTSLIALFAWLVALQPGQASEFKFSNPEPQEQEPQGEQQTRVKAMLPTPCRNKIKNQKTLVLIGESQNGQLHAAQSSFSPQVDAVNLRLQALGLRTYTQAQIRQQVAQAEIDAYFKNDPDAALGASRRLAAQYILKGLITTQAGRNQAVHVNQVSIRMDFTLSAANGKLLGQASAENASYAGQDTAGMALTLIKERADELVATLYKDYCQNAGVR